MQLQAAVQWKQSLNFAVDDWLQTVYRYWNMKWIVTLPDGKEVETTGGDESAAASNAIDANFDKPRTAEDKSFTVQVRKKIPKMHGDKDPKTIYVTPHFYWSCSQWR